MTENMTLTKEHLLFLARLFDDWNPGDELYPVPDLPDGLHDAIEAMATQAGLSKQPYAGKYGFTYEEWADPDGDPPGAHSPYRAEP